MKKKIQDIVVTNWWVILLILIILLGERFIGTAEVNGQSMENTLKDGDLLLVRRTDHVQDGDIVAIWSDRLDEFLCKRVIGIGGDNLVIIDGSITRNQKQLVEPYIKEENWGKDLDTAFIVPDKEVYVLGDNRNYSTDSRDLGTISTNKIYGVVVCNLTKTLNIKKKTIWVLFVSLWVLYLLLIFCGKKKVKEEQTIPSNEGDTNNERE